MIIVVYCALLWLVDTDSLLMLDRHVQPSTSNGQLICLPLNAWVYASRQPQGVAISAGVQLDKRRHVAAVTYDQSLRIQNLGLGFEG